jgi:hypothetical protein
MLAKKASRASSPPAEAPFLTMGKDFFLGFRSISSIYFICYFLMEYL